MPHGSVERAPARNSASGWRFATGGSADFKFRFQHSVWPHVADFACLEAMVIVEIDGSQHGPERDTRRTAKLEASGYLVLRFWNSDVIENLQGVLESVLAACQRRHVR